MTLSAMADAWRKEGSAAAARVAKTLGLQVTKEQLDALGAAIHKANGTRKVRLLEPPQSTEAIAAALVDPHGVGMIHGGEANQGEQRTTLCLAFYDREKGTMTIDVAAAPARGASPGSVWSELQPWSRVAPEKNVPKLQKHARKAKKTDRVAFQVSKTPSRARKQAQGARLGDAKGRGEALLAAIAANPDDDDARAVYADYLSELGDPRGELISVQLALEGAKKGSKAAKELLERSNELLKKHAAAWSVSVAQFTMKQEYARGFIRAVTIRPRSFVTNGERLFELAPTVERVRIKGTDLSSIRALARSPSLQRVKELEILGSLQDAPAEALASSPHLGALRGLDIANCGVTLARTESFLEACPKLEWIEVSLLTEALAEAILRGTKATVRTWRLAKPKATTPARGQKGKSAVRTLEQQGRVVIVPSRSKV